MLVEGEGWGGVLRRVGPGGRGLEGCLGGWKGDGVGEGGEELLGERRTG